jgi:membrane protein required for colicin V production
MSFRYCFGCISSICFIHRYEKWAFIELASLISLILGIYIMHKMLYDKSNACQSRFLVSKYIEIIAFGLTFVAVVLAVHIVQKLTGIMDFAFLGILIN